MALTQIQIIQSLAEALSWFEKELSWGVAPGELGHLTGRIGELYAAMITRGQMALETHQRGYDVISAENERISVKTFTSSAHIAFNAGTLEYVDRVMILRLNVDDENGISVETIKDGPAAEILAECRQGNGKLIFDTMRLQRVIRPVEDLRVVEEVQFRQYLLRRYENGSIDVLTDGEVHAVVKPVLREIAAIVGVEILNGNSMPKNTRQLGADVMRTIKALPERTGTDSL